MDNKLHRELKKIRKNIPDKYNQLEMMDYLDDNDSDLFFSITTRTDGKTFNYLYGLASLAESLQFTTLIIVRHAELRNAMIAQIEDVYRTMKTLDNDKMNIRLNYDVTSVTTDTATPFLIVDLNNANDLKNYSAILKQANIILYDEFLAVGGEYTNAEFKKWKVIFETMDRGESEGQRYTNNRRKAIFLANPVDFGSEFLAHYDMYEMLEKQPMNTVEKHGMIVLERRKNINAQEGKNNRIFNDDTNESITGDFYVNSWAINKPRDGDIPVVVKSREEYILIYPNRATGIPIISVKPYVDHYEFNTEAVDNSDNSEYLDPRRFYRDNYEKKYAKEEFHFENQYSKQLVLTNYPTLNIGKVLRHADIPDETDIDYQTKKFEYNEEAALKQRLLKQYLG